MEGDNSGNFFSNKNHLQMFEKQFWQLSLWKNITWDLFQKISVAFQLVFQCIFSHDSKETLKLPRSFNFVCFKKFTVHPGSELPVDQLTKAIVGIKLTCQQTRRSRKKHVDVQGPGPSNMCHVGFGIWNFSAQHQLTLMSGNSGKKWMPRGKFLQKTSQLIIFINISTIVFLPKSSIETQIPKKTKSIFKMLLQLNQTLIMVTWS